MTPAALENERVNPLGQILGNPSPSLRTREKRGPLQKANNEVIDLFCYSIVSLGNVAWSTPLFSTGGGDQGVNSLRSTV